MRFRRLMASGVLAYLAFRAFRRGRRNLTGKVVLITGSSRGLGLVMAREFGKHGCRLVLCARDPDELESARRQLESSGVPVLALTCDVTRPEQVARLVSEAEGRFGAIDVLVCNAGIIQVGPLQSMTLDDFQRAMAVNFYGALHAIVATVARMKERGSGHIVNITSIGGKVAFPHLLPYDASKFALVGLSEGLRAELGRYGIRVTTVVPGLMRTGSPVNAWFKGDAQREYEWFAAGDATVLTSMRPERVARRVVQAVRRGETEVTIGWQARALRLAHDLLPGLTISLLGLAARALPEGTADERVQGRDLELSAGVGRRISRAAARYNQELSR